VPFLAQKVVKMGVSYVAVPADPVKILDSLVLLNTQNPTPEDVANVILGVYFQGGWVDPRQSEFLQAYYAALTKSKPLDDRLWAIAPDGEEDDLFSSAFNSFGKSYSNGLPCREWMVDFNTLSAESLIAKYGKSWRSEGSKSGESLEATAEQVDESLAALREIARTSGVTMDLPLGPTHSKAKLDESKTNLKNLDIFAKTAAASQSGFAASALREKRATTVQEKAEKAQKRARKVAMMRAKSELRNELLNSSPGARAAYLRGGDEELLEWARDSGWDAEAEEWKEGFDSAQEYAQLLEVEESQLEDSDYQEGFDREFDRVIEYYENEYLDPYEADEMEKIRLEEEAFEFEMQQTKGMFSMGE